jgi:hypothetical protein
MPALEVRQKQKYSRHQYGGSYSRPLRSYGFPDLHTGIPNDLVARDMEFSNENPA